MLNHTIEIIKMIWLFLNGLISLDHVALRDDARKVGLGLTTTGVLGFVVQFDKITSHESMLLFVVGMLIWVLALLKPKVDTEEENNE